MAEPFASQCSVVVSNTYDTCGTFTRASINPLTPTQLQNLFKQDGLWADMDSFFRTQFEMKACGTRTVGLYDWLMSSTKPMGKLVNTVKVDKSPSLIQPFVLARQKSVINTDFWAITTGYAHGSYTAETTGPLTSAQKALGTSTDRIIRVVSRYGIDLDAKWFIDRDVVYIFGRSGGVATNGSWKVLASAVSADLSYIDVLVRGENAGNSQAYTDTPTSGVLLPGVNNVNDFESWCNNRPALNPEKRVPFWVQTMRRTRCVDQLYKEVFAKLMKDNRYFAEFADLPLAEKNRQDEEEFQKRWVHTFFFGKPISANQTLALYQNLEQILTVNGDVLDPGTGGQAVAYRANMVGVKQQLLACDRVRDLENQPMKLRELFDEIYNIVRSRKSQGRPATSIDIWTDSATAAEFHSAMMDYYRAEYGEDTLRINASISSGRKEDFGFFWRTFQLNYPFGVEVNIITNEFFDDLRSAFSTENIDSVGRYFLILDMGKGGTIYPGMIASNRKVSTLGRLEELSRLDQTFACVMENVTKEITMTSQTNTVVVECPSNSLWVENFSGFDAGAKTTPYGDLYSIAWALIGFGMSALGAVC